MVWWLWGSFAVYDLDLVLMVSVPVLLGILALYFFARDLNALSMGDEEAMHLGVDAQKLKKIMIVLTALITGAVICVSGMIGFVGLIVPHMVRIVAGHNHKVLIPAACITASVFMILCDLLSRTLFAPVEIPVGVITAVVGSPVFVILLKRRFN